MKKSQNTFINLLSLLFIIPLFFNSCKPDETMAVIETCEVTFITEETATCGGMITSDGGAIVEERGVCWSISQNPTIENSKTFDAAGTGAFTSTITGLTPVTTYYVRAYATNKAGTGYGLQVSFTTQNGVTDIDGNFYHTITIGTQEWMVENLRTTKYNDGTSIPFVSNHTAWSNLTSPGYCFCRDDAAGKNKYGALYNWYTVNTGKLAPIGWHVPTDTEWTILENYLVANGYNYDGTTTGNKIAKSLAATTDWKSSPGTGAIGNDLKKNNTSGFAALPGGFRHSDATFYGVGDSGYWWSSTESNVPFTNATDVWARSLYYGSYLLAKDASTKSYGFSVRCVRDSE